MTELMKITKYLHSCIHIDDNGTSLLFDPGAFSFVENALKPSDLPKADAVFITHKHQDHFFPDALRAIVKDETKLYVPADLIKELPDGMTGNLAMPASQLQISNTTVDVIASEHGDLPVPKPENAGYVVNGRVYHPGDSVTVDVENIEVLLLPMFSPWATVLAAIEFAKRLKPKLVIPIHDGFVKPFFLDGIYENMCRPVLEKEGIEFRPLGLGESVEV